MQKKTEESVRQSFRFSKFECCFYEENGKQQPSEAQPNPTPTDRQPSSTCDSTVRSVLVNLGYQFSVQTHVINTRSTFEIIKRGVTHDEPFDGFANGQ